MVRGRGYGRGGGGGRGGSSYRGSGGSNYRSGSGRSSFNYSSSRGSYSGGSSSYNYDSRNRDRAPTRHNSDRHEDHKRSYRNSSRDRSSPDRKRSRHEDSRPSSSYSTTYRRNESSRSSRQTPPPPTVRSSSAPYRRDDSSSHRHSNANDSMGPPKSLPPRSGRIIRPRGGASSHIRGSSIRGGSSLRIVRNTRESTDMRIMRKKLLLANQRDRARRIKIAKLTSSLRNKRRDVPGPRKVIRKPRGDKKDDESKNDDDEDDDDDAEKDKTKEEDDEDETVDGEKGEEQKVTKKEPKRDKEGKTNDDVDDEEDEDEDEEEIGTDDELLDDKDDDDIEEKDDDIESKSKRDLKLRRPKKQFIKLTCVHCRAKCLTFKEYSNHLYSRNHKLAMRRLALRQKTQLAHMRLTQRNAQRDIEENAKDDMEDCKSQYCLLCRLNYRQPKAKHQLSESHRSMKKFLMPYCSTCHIAYKSPMVYETHRCSLEHIKRKARNNESANSESSDGEKEVDLTNFMTVDSVGEIDGGEIDEKHEGEDGKDKINVGAEHVKKTEVFYCDLCRYYFPFKDDEEALVKKHCGTRSHLKAFVRFKEDQNLRLEAERIQRRQKEAKEKKKEIAEKAAATVAEKEAGENAEENEEGGEDKIWEDVDKDLGDLLREVGPDGDHEDDEEDGSVLNINIERFDRFKNSEKQKQKELNGNGTEEDAVVEVKIEEKANEVVVPVKSKKEIEKKSETTAKKSDTTAKKSDAAVKKSDAAVKKSDAAIKKSEAAAAKKTDATVKADEKSVEVK